MQTWLPFYDSRKALLKVIFIFKTLSVSLNKLTCHSVDRTVDLKNIKVNKTSFKTNICKMCDIVVKV